MQNSHDYVAVRPHPARTPAVPHALPTSSTLSVGPSSLPAKPTWTAPPPESQISEIKEVSKLVAGGNSSIVANRKAIRMANLNAADMLKAELAGGLDFGPSSPRESNASAAESLKKEMADSQEKEDAEEKMIDEDTTPRGTKRKVEAVVTPDVEEEEEEDEDADVVAFLTSAVANVETVVAGVGGARTTTVTTAPPLTVTGNMVEQEDTVK